MRSGASTWGSGLWRLRRAALLLHALEPILEAAQCVLFLPQLQFCGSAALLQLEQILCLVPVQLELQRRNTALTLADIRQQLCSLLREPVRAPLQEVPSDQPEDVALPPERERDLAV